MIGVFTGLAAVIPYAEPIPWLELQTIIVFAAGYLLGGRAGALIGGLAMAFYSLANPQGMAHPGIFASQIIGRALVGAMGGWAARLGLPGPLLVRGLVLAVWGFTSALAFDLSTNTAVGLVYGQLIPSLIAGIPFAFGHLVSNTILFVVVGLPLLSFLDTRKTLLAVLPFLILVMSVANVSAQDESSATTDSVDSGASEITAADTLETTPAVETAQDSIGSHPADWDSTGTSDGDSLGIPLRPPSRPFVREPRWAMRVEPRANWRHAPTDADDALTLLADAPRFYGSEGSTEPLRFSAVPGGLEVGSRDGSPQWARSTPWQEPGWIGEGGRASWVWAPLGRPVSTPLPILPPRDNDRRRDAGPGSDSQAGWDNASVRPRLGRPLTSVWIGGGTFRRSTQGFNLQLWQNVAGVPLGILWSAWTRRTAPIGELASTGAHGVEIGLAGRGQKWRARVDYESNRVALADRSFFTTENRSLQKVWGRLDWFESTDHGWFLGTVTSHLNENTWGERIARGEMQRRAQQTSASGWVGQRGENWELGSVLSWQRQRVRMEEFQVPIYTPKNLDLFSLTLEAKRKGFFGDWRVILGAENADGGTQLMPQLYWRRGGTGPTQLYAAAGRTLSNARAEAGKLGDPDEGPLVESTDGWMGVLGLRLVRGEESVIELVEGLTMNAALSGGAFRMQTSIIAWSLEGVLFPAYGLFARDVLQGQATNADVDGAALTTRIEWAPIFGLETDLAAYAAARQVPIQTASAAPDYRAVLAVGPRLHLFSANLELAIQGEVDVIGERVAEDEVLPPVLRVGGRIIVSFGPAWAVLRFTDLDDQFIPLPGRTIDGRRLFSPGRQIRFYGEWRLLD